VKGGDFVERPALWKAQDVTPAGTRGLTLFAGAEAVGQAQSINGTGTVAGVLETETAGTQVFLWTAAGGVQLLGSLGGATVGPVKLNGAGQIAGTGATASGLLRAFVWPLSKF
jgi:hypothetical protein